MSCAGAETTVKRVGPLNSFVTTTRGQRARLARPREKPSVSVGQHHIVVDSEHRAGDGLARFVADLSTHVGRRGEAFQSDQKFLETFTDTVRGWTSRVPTNTD